MTKKRSNQEQVLFDKALENGHAILFTPERMTALRLKDRLYNFRTRHRKNSENGNKYDDIVISVTPDKLSVRLTVERLEGTLIELTPDDEISSKVDGVILSDLVTPVAEEQREQENLIEAMKKKAKKEEKPLPFSL